MTSMMNSPSSENSFISLRSCGIYRTMSKEGPLNQMQSVVVRAEERLQSCCRARREQISFPSHPVTPGPSASLLLKLECSSFQRPCFFSLGVQFCHSVKSGSLRPHGLQHARPPCPSATPRVCSSSCPLSR